MTIPALSLTSLAHGNLGNHNAGRGSGNHTELKKYDDNKPYISGQSRRHAIRHAIQQAENTGVDCEPSHACGEIGDCIICDLFGYMEPKRFGGDDDKPPKRRYSPIKVTPLKGLYPTGVTSDLITQPDPEDADDNSMATRELTENVYHGAVSIDVSAIGSREIEDVDTDREYYEQYTREQQDEISVEERRNRVKSLLDAHRNATRFAGQARHMADLTPDILLGATLDTFSNRLANAIHVDPESRDLNLECLDRTLRELTDIGASIHYGGSRNPEVIGNWDALEDLLSGQEYIETHGTVGECYEALKTELDATN